MDCLPSGVMGKHNGKARNSGTKVGSALVNSARKVTDLLTSGTWYHRSLNIYKCDLSGL